MIINKSNFSFLDLNLIGVPCFYITNDDELHEALLEAEKGHIKSAVGIGGDYLGNWFGSVSLRCVWIMSFVRCKIKLIWTIQNVNTTKKS